MLTVKQERFARLVFETGNQSEAYRRAYDVGRDTKPESIYVSASELMADPNIALRVKDLEAEAVAMSMVTKEMVVRGLLHEAMNAKNEGTRVRAWELLGKTNAMFTDVRKSIHDETEESLAARWRALTEEAKR